MPILLAKDWDLPTQPAFLSKDKKELGHFVGRLEEVDNLTNEIIRRTSGSILVSGHRGVGKTSMIYHSLNLVKAIDEKCIFVLISAPQLESQSSRESKDENQASDIRNNIIKNIIRRLFSSIKEQVDSEDFFEDVQILYRKAVATEFNLFESNDHNFESNKSIEGKFNISFDFQKIIKSLLNYFAPVLLFSSVIFRFPYWEIAAITSLLIPLFTASASFNLSSSNIDIMKSNAGELYNFDNNISNLEFDLENLHRKIAASGYKIVYIIDEMDKLSKGKPGEILKYFKNLFTISQAIFLFVGGQKLFDLGNDGTIPEDDWRHAEYTYFNSRYFLSRPNWFEIEKYLGEIMLVQNESNEFIEEDYQIIMRSISFDAQNDYFDIKNCINYRINKFDTDRNPIIFSEITSEDRKKSNFHKIISLIYEKYFSESLSNRKQNEELIKILFDHAQSLLKLEINSKIVEPAGRSVTDSIVRDFFHILNKVGVFGIDSVEERVTSTGKEKINTYVYLGSFRNSPPLTLLDKLEYENKYLFRFEKYSDYIYQLADFFRKQYKDPIKSWPQFLKNPADYASDYDQYGFNILPKFIELSALYNEVKLPNSKINRDDVEKASNDLDAHQKLILENLPRTFSNLLHQLIENAIHDDPINSNFFLSDSKIIGEFNRLSKKSFILKSQKSNVQFLFINSSNDLEKFLDLSFVKSFLRQNNKERRIILFCDILSGIKKFNAVLRISTLDSKKLKNEFVKIFKIMDKNFK